MTFRARLLVAFGAAAVVPILLLAAGVRREMGHRFTEQYVESVRAMAAFIESDIEREGEAIADRLAALRASIAEDNRFRLGVLGEVSARAYVLDYAGRAMRTAGLDMLQVQDDSGRIVSSGHFRNDFDRVAPRWRDRLAAAPGGRALLTARTATGPLLTLAYADSLSVGGQSLSVVGGVAVDRRFLERMTRGGEFTLSVIYPGGVVTSARVDSGPAADVVGRSDAIVAELGLPFLDQTNGDAAPSVAKIVVAHPGTALSVLQRRVDLWFIGVVIAAGIVALVAAGWLSTRISRPLTALARRTQEVDLDRLDVDFTTDRDDEIGRLSQLLAAMTARLRAGAVRLRDVERRATVGDLARQINHDIKNGLAPLRHVFRHLGEVKAENPEVLPEVFDERSGTVESSITYLENLATNYARLSPRFDRRPSDVNEVVRAVVGGAHSNGRITVRAVLSPRLPPVLADPLVLRRMLENVVTNGIDALDDAPGSVSVTTSRVSGSPGAVRIVIEDTGRGMTKDECDRAFDDFFTTKPEGTGLGLSIVRRLVLDVHGSVRVETEPGTGTRVILEIPVAASDR